MSLTKHDFLFIAILVFAVVALFYPFFLQGKILLPPNATSAYPWYGTDAQTRPHPQGSMDAVRENYITWAHHKTYLENGYAPYWNPFIFAGNSLVANNFAIPFSPYKLLNFIFSAPVAWSWSQILKTFFNGLFTYLSLRALQRSRIAATVGALGWMLSWPLAHQTQTTYSEGVAMLPILFFFTLRSYQSETHRQQWGYGLAGALVAGLHFLSGNIQMSVYVFLLLFGFAVYWTWEKWRAGDGRKNRIAEQTVDQLPLAPAPTSWAWTRPVLTLILVYTGGVLIGAVQIATTYELLGYSIRGAAQTYQNKGILPYVELSFLNPWLYFWRNFEFADLKDQYWLNDRWNPYIGIVPLFAMLLAVRFVKDRTARAVMFLSFGLLVVLHLLYFRPIFNLVSDLPGYNVLDHERFLIVIPFSLVVISAYGLDWLLDFAPQHYRKLRPLLVLASLLLPFMLILLLAAMTFFAGEVADAEKLPVAVCADNLSADGMYDVPTQESVGTRLVITCTDPITAFQNQEIQIGTDILADYYTLENALFAISFIYVGAALILCWLYASGKITRPAMGGALIALTLLDLVIFANVNIAAADEHFIYPPTPAIEFLQNQDGVFRINAKNNTLREGAYTAYRNDHAWYLSSTLEPLIPNTAGLYGLQDVRGYESVYTEAYSRYLARIDGREGIFGAGAWLTNTVTHPMLDMLNVRYVLSIEPLDEPGLQEVYRGEIYIYENLKTVPRVQLYRSYTILRDENAVLEAMDSPDFDPHTQLFTTEQMTSPPAPRPINEDGTFSPSLPAEGEINLTRYEPNRVTMDVSTNQPAILVLADMDYPGWNAYVDNEKVEITRANYLFRAIVVPAGDYTVEFRYESEVVRGSLWVSGISLGVVTLALLVLLGRSFRDSLIKEKNV